MDEVPARTLVFDSVGEAEAPTPRGVQQLWREQNAAFRAKMLGQIRHVRAADERTATA